MQDRIPTTASIDMEWWREAFQAVRRQCDATLERAIEATAKEFVNKPHNLYGTLYRPGTPPAGATYADMLMECQRQLAVSRGTITGYPIELAGAARALEILVAREVQFAVDAGSPAAANRLCIGEAFTNLGGDAT